MDAASISAITSVRRTTRTPRQLRTALSAATGSRRNCESDKVFMGKSGIAMNRNQCASKSLHLPSARRFQFRDLLRRRKLIFRYEYPLAIGKSARNRPRHQGPTPTDRLSAKRVSTNRQIDGVAHRQNSQFFNALEPRRSRAVGPCRNGIFDNISIRSQTTDK